MKKLVAILLVTVLLCGCAVPNDAKTTQEREPASAQEASETPEPKPKSVELPAKISFNKGTLSETEEEGVFYVDLSNGHQERPPMPIYAWYINGTGADMIDEVVIEFDVFGTVPPLDGEYFGYDQAFYITLHNFETIPLIPPWPEDFVYDSHLMSRGNTGRADMLAIPEIGVDLQKYAVWDGEHVRIAIPYSEFQNASKDLTLQFLPGTTYGNLSACLFRADGLQEDAVETVSQPIAAPEHNLFEAVMKPLLNDFSDRLGFNPSTNFENVARELRDRIYGGGGDKINVIGDGLIVNSDGSVNMPASFYDLGEYANQVQGKYVVIPEGLVSVFATISQRERFSDEQQRRIIDFVFENMMDETGQFYGIYDIAQEKVVAAERRVASLPILSALLANRDVLTDREIDLIANSIIANEIVRVGDTVYYAPNGIDEDGVMDLHLYDFAISDEFFYILTEYSQNSRRLDEKYGCAILLEGLANSLKLVLEAQEQNPTRLPSTELRVVFSGDGESCELQPSDTFDIKNSYFSIGLVAFEFFYQVFEQYKYYDVQGSFDAKFARLSKVQGSAYTQKQEQTIRDAEALYAEVYNAYTIANTLYESWLDVYNFLRIQPSDTIYANAYNVHTGEIIEASGEALYPSFSDVKGFRKHFGTPATSMNYFLLTGMFNDREMALESGYLAFFNFDIHKYWMLSSLNPSNPDMFVDNGFNIWGYDSLQYTMMGDMTATTMTRQMYDTSGICINRENWRVFAMRKINQFTEDEANFLTPDEAFPTFYDQIPAVEIAK